MQKAWNFSPIHPSLWGYTHKNLKEGSEILQNSSCLRAFRRPFLTGLALSLLVMILPFATLDEAPESPSLEPSKPVISPRPLAVASPIPIPSPAASVPTLQPEPPSPAKGVDAEATIRVLMQDGITVKTLSLADYLWSVVAAEMPATFEPEALRAQAVCARTYAASRARTGVHSAKSADVCAGSGCCTAFIDPKDAAQRWGDYAEAYTAIIRDAVSDTDGIILTWDGEPIQAVFFSSAAGNTEDAETVWGYAIPYLVHVESPEGDEVPNYHSTVSLTPQEVQACAQRAGLWPDLSGPPSTWFQGLTRTAGGQVSEIKLGGIALSGNAARNLFSLRSASFDVSWDGSVFVFSVTGFGHGVGLSQYGANALAKQGYTWQEIVLHYYTGVSLGTYPV